MASRKVVRSFAGLGEWVAGVVPQLKPFMTMVWAALNSDGKDNQFIFVQQITRPLNWVDNPQTFVRTIHIDPPVEQIIISVDASPWGGGAVLWMIPAGELPDPTYLQEAIPAQRFSHTTWANMGRSCWRPSSASQLVRQGGKPLQLWLPCALGKTGGAPDTARPLSWETL